MDVPAPPTQRELRQFRQLCAERERAIVAMECGYAFTLQDRINSLLKRYNDAAYGVA